MNLTLGPSSIAQRIRHPSINPARVVLLTAVCFLGLKLLNAQAPAAQNTVTKPRQTSVVIAGERFLNISDVSLADTPDCIRIMHDAGVRVFKIAEVPQEFLDSWQIPSKRAQAIRETDPNSKEYIYSTHQLRTQLQNQPRERVLAALGSSDFTVIKSFSFRGLGDFSLSKDIAFTEVYKDRRIRETIYGPLGSNNDLSAREYNVLLVAYTKDSAKGLFQVRSVDFGERKPSGLILVESSHPGGRELEIYRDRVEACVYKFSYVAVRPQEGRKINAIFQGPSLGGDMLVLTFDRYQLVPIMEVFEKWQAATEEAVKNNKDRESEIGKIEASGQTYSFMFRYTASTKSSSLLVQTYSGGRTLKSEVPFEAFETWKDFFRDSDRLLRETIEFFKDLK